MATTPSESSEVESPSGKTLNQSEDNSNSPLVIVVGIAGYVNVLVYLHFIFFYSLKWTNFNDIASHHAGNL